MDSSDADPLGIILILILILVLTYINAFFAGAEMAVVSIHPNKLKKLKESGNKKAKLLEKLINDATKFLSTIQVAITLAGFLSSATAGSQLSGAVVLLFAKIGINLNETIAVILITLLLSYFTLVFGELFPKRLALKNPEKVALRSVRVVYIVMIIASPFVKLLSASTNFILALTGNSKNTNPDKISEDEIKSLILTGHTEGLINEDEKEMLESIFKFDDLNADAIMTPRPNVYAINIDKPVSETISQIIDQGYSRIPVYQRDIDNIIGVLHVKDLLKEANLKGFENVNIKNIIRKPYFVPKYIKIDILFKNMKATNNQIAILIDEYGGSAGIVTIEDLVEEIVGNIYDEYDEVDKTIQTVDDNTYLIDGGIPIQDLNRRLKLYLDENNEEYDTLGGLIIFLLGYIPSQGFKDEIEYNNLIFKIHKIKQNRIDEVLLTIKQPENDETDENEDNENE